MFPSSALFFIQLAVVLIFIQLIDAQDDYIVGGLNVKEGVLPYQISLQYNKQHKCGGSIIDNCWILTAAYCVAGVPKAALSILAGTTKLNSGGVRVAVDKVISHEKYGKPFRISNNIALIKLKQCLKYNPNIKAVDLSNAEYLNGANGVVSGWGFINQNRTQTTDDLKALPVRIISNEECSKTFGKVIENGNLCTFNVVGYGTCQGDGGGPLVEVITKRLVGLVSASVPCARGKPDIYTRTAMYLNWIIDNINR